MRAATVIAAAALVATASVEAVLNPEFVHPPPHTSEHVQSTARPNLRIPATGYKNLTLGIPMEDTATAVLGQPWTVYNYYQFSSPVGQGFKVSELIQCNFDVHF